MKTYWRGSYYYLALICLVVAIVLLQPRPITCCTTFQAWLPSGTSFTLTTFLNAQYIGDDIDATTVTEQSILERELQGGGYVFSFPTSTDGLQSTMPPVQSTKDIQDEVVEDDFSFQEPTLESTITATSTSINLLGVPETAPKEVNRDVTKSQHIFSLSTVIILLTSSIMKGASGFAFALLMMPLLVWNGFSLVEANIFTSINGFVLSCFMVYRLRKDVLWKVLWPTLIPRVGGMMIGILLLGYLNGLDKVLIRQLLGVVLLVTVVIQLMVRVKARAHIKRHWWWLALGSSGLLGGMAGFAGPPVVLWVMAHNWTNIQSRALLAALYGTIVPIQIVLLLLTFGKPVAELSLQAIYFMPVVVVGVFAGIYLGNQLNKPRLRKFAQALLLLTAIMSLSAPYIGLT